LQLFDLMTHCDTFVAGGILPVCGDGKKLKEKASKALNLLQAQ
jgi:hypothetical protein